MLYHSTVYGAFPLVRFSLNFLLGLFFFLRFFSVRKQSCISYYYYYYYFMQPMSLLSLQQSQKRNSRTKKENIPKMI